MGGPAWSYKPNKFYQLLIGFFLTVLLWPIPLALAIWLDFKGSAK
jgi:hypothetical protein